MDQRKKMIELIQKIDSRCKKYGCEDCDYHADLMKGDEGFCLAERTADYLLAHGVIIPPCKVGDTLYSSAHSDNGEKIEEFSVVFVGMVSLDSRWVVLYQKISADEREGDAMLPKTYECGFDEIGEKVFTSEKEALEKGGKKNEV